MISPAVTRAMRHGYIAALDASGALTRARRHAAARGTAVLTLHRVVPDAELPLVRSPRGMVLRESLFAQLVDFLAEECCCVSLQGAADLRHGSERPRVLITFDDGWADNADIAWPYLRFAGLPMCLFVTTGLVDHPEPFWVERFLGVVAAARTGGTLPALYRTLCGAFAEWPWQHQVPVPPCGALQGDAESFLPFLKQFPSEKICGFLAGCEVPQKPDRRERLLSWRQLRRLRDEGVSLGSHSVTHPILTQLDEATLQVELACSRQALDMNLQPADTLTYPNGDADARVAAAARAAGYRYAFTNTPGLWTPDTDLLHIPRINVWDGTLTDDRGRFSRARVLYSLFWRSRHNAEAKAGMV